jgi:hypothetical protein
LAIRVREKPPLRQSIVATTPSGKRYRWGEDEPRPENVFADLRYSDSMPGGYETMDCQLPRKPGIDYSDVERLTTLNIYGAGGEPEGEYRLERAPKVSGDRMAISPSAVGWVAQTEDDKTASVIGIDRDLTRWRGASSQRRLNNANQGRQTLDPEVVPDETQGVPSLRNVVRGAWAATGLPFAEAYYDAGSGKSIGRLRADGNRNNNLPAGGGNWELFANLLDTDDLSGASNGTGNIFGAGPFSVDLAATTATRRHAMLALDNASAGGTDGVEYALRWTLVRVIGNHDLPLVGSGADEGLRASDFIAYAVGRWAPLLVVKPDSIKPSSYVVPHLVFYDGTTVAEMIRQASRFELPYWGVWDQREFIWDPNRTPRKRWRARVGPAQLEETGQSVERLWESIVVQYRDVGGSTRTVGPPGSGADVEDASLKDPDPENPANRLGMVKRDLLVMGTGTSGSAIQVARQFLSESKLLDTSGRARLVGFVEDDRGVLYPYSRVRSGDEIAFTDAADPSYRRIVHSDKVRPERACAIDLDAPPEGLKALLERLDVELVPLGIS